MRSLTWHIRILIRECVVEVDNMSAFNGLNPIFEQAEVDATEGLTPPDDQMWRGAQSGRQRPRILLAICAAVTGVALIAMGADVLETTTAVIRVALVAAGVAAIMFCFANVARATFGPGFELGLWLSLFWLLVLGLAATFADLLPLSESRNVAETLSTPTLLRPDLFSAHPLGTDKQGLDILGGVVYGARVSLVVSMGAVAIGVIIGGLVGVTAGYYRGKTEAMVNVMTDSLLAFPPLILLLAMVAVLQPTVRNVTIALGVLGIPTYIRLSRANTLVLAQREFVLSARAMGASDRRIIARELIPNVARPVLAYGFIVIGVLIVAEASLSFLGLSIQRPNPTWGNMIAAAQEDFRRHPHAVFGPGLVLCVTVCALNRVGDAARNLWDRDGVQR